MSRPRLWYAAVAIALFPGLVAAQDTTRAQTVATLKLVAEAVAGYPGRGTVYVVLDSTREVAAVVTSRSQADSVMRNLRGRGEIHGPVASPSVSADLIMRCVHDGRTSVMQMCNGRIPRIALSDIATISLVIGMRSGASHRIQLPATGDAIFLTRSAFDKFAVPYYVRLHGVDVAAAMRQRMVDEDRRRP